MAVLLCASCQKESDVVDKTVKNDSEKLVATAEASDVSLTSAVLTGYVNFMADASEVSFGFVYSIKEDPTFRNGEIKKVTSDELDSVNKYTVRVNGLTQLTKYYYRAFINVNGVYQYGEVMSFTTGGITVTTDEVRSIGLVSATVGMSFSAGRYTSADGNIIKCGVIYSSEMHTAETLKQSGTVVNSDVEMGTSGQCEFTIKGLDAATRYYYMAYIEYEGIKYCGAVNIFKTNEINVHTGYVKDISLTSATLGLSLDNFIASDIGYLKGGILYKVLTDPNDYGGDELKNSGIETSSDMSSSTCEFVVNGLNMFQNYSYLAYIECNGVRYYGKMEDFSTGWSEVYTEYAKNISSTSATIGMNFNIYGQIASGEIEQLKVGVIYSSEVRTAEDLIEAGIEVSSDFNIASSGNHEFILTDLKSFTGYYYTAYIEVNGTKFYSGDLNGFTTVVLTSGAVDMGLSVKWASCNLGENGFVDSPEDEGSHFAWGEIESKSEYTWETYKWCNGTEKTLTKYNINHDCGPVVDDKTTLEPEDDAAYVKLGGNWRMPTYNEWEELSRSCKWRVVPHRGTLGVLLTASNGNSIFIPYNHYIFKNRYYGENDSDHFYGGYYWTSSRSRYLIYSGAEVMGFGAFILNGSVDLNSRCLGRSIRPVTE